MSDYGYPTSTNRAGAWFRRTSGPSQAVAPRVGSAPNHLSEVLRPVKERGIQAVKLVGLDTEAERLRDLTNGDQEQMNRLGRAINDAIAASILEYPSFIGRDKSEHQISQGELKRRINWCIEIAQQMRFDQKPRWSFDRICQRLPHLLMHFLRGELETAISGDLSRGMYAKNQIPKDLKPAPEEDGEG